MTKPKKSAEDFLKNVLFPLRINLKTLRSLQELTSELGMGEFISWNADAERQLKTFINLQERALKVMFALTPPNIFYSLHFEQILRYPFLRKFFEDMPAFQELYEYYKRHHELPQPDNPLETFLKLLSNFTENLTLDFLLKIALEGPYAIFKTVWDTIGNAYDIMTLEPVELLQKLEKKVSIDPNLIFDSLLDPTTAVLANPYEWLWFAVLTSTIALKEAYELPDMTPEQLPFILHRIRPYLLYGTTSIITEDGKTIEKWIQPLETEYSRTIELKNVKEWTKKGIVTIKAYHEGMMSEPFTLSKNMIIVGEWLTPEGTILLNRWKPTAARFIISTQPKINRLIICDYQKETWKALTMPVAIKATIKIAENKALAWGEGTGYLLDLKTAEIHQVLDVDDAVTDLTNVYIKSGNKLLVYRYNPDSQELEPIHEVEIEAESISKLGLKNNGNAVLFYGDKHNLTISELDATTLELTENVFNISAHTIIYTMRPACNAFNMAVIDIPIISYSGYPGKTGHWIWLLNENKEAIDFGFFRTNVIEEEDHLITPLNNYYVRYPNYKWGKLNLNTMEQTVLSSNFKKPVYPPLLGPYLATIGHVYAHEPPHSTGGEVLRINDVDFTEEELAPFHSTSMVGAGLTLYTVRTCLVKGTSYVDYKYQLESRTTTFKLKKILYTKSYYSNNQMYVIAAI